MRVDTVSVRTSVRLGAALVRHRALPFLTLLAASAVVAATILGVSTVRGSIESALRTSVEADAARQPFAVQAGTATARQAIAATPALVPVADIDGVLDTDDARTQTVVRATGEPDLQFGTLIEGQYPTRQGEATVSRSVADATRTVVGDSVTLRRDATPVFRAVIVGITVDTADALDATTVVVDGAVDASSATLWLASSDPYAEERLRPLMDARAITYRHTESASTAAAAVLPVEDSALRSIQRGLGALLAVVLIGLLMVFAPLARRDAATLTAAGMSGRDAWRIVGSVPVLAVLAGLVLSSVGVVAVASVAREGLSGWFGQYWVEVSWPVGTTLVMLAAVLAVVALVRPGAVMVERTRRRLLRPVSSRTSRRGMGVPGACIAVTIGIAVIVAGCLRSRADEPPAWSGSVALPGAAAVLVGLLYLLGRVNGHISRPAVAAVRTYFGAGIAVTALAASLVVLWSSSSAARGTHDANAFEQASGGAKQRGSLLLTEVPVGAADLIEDRYRQLGGNEVRQYDLVDELASQLRVTGTRLVGCLEAAGTLNADAVSPECFPQQTNAPVAIVALARSAQTPSLADPGLLENGDVGLIRFATGKADASELGITRAEPDPSLGGNLPGLVVDPRGTVARRFGLQASGTRLVGLMDFGALPTTDRARMRSVVAQAAPAAQVAESSEVGSYDAERARANVVAFAGAVLASILLLAGGVGVVLGSARTRRVLVEVGAPRAQRIAIVLTWIGVPTTLVVLASGLGRLSATIGGVAADGDYGSFWLVPAGAALACCSALAVVMMRVPARSRE